jgi:beta-phosphoglucomutase-like phosphatase (HAD superfamily)
MAELVAVGALDTGPILWLGTVPRLMTLLIAVAAAEDSRLGAVAGHVADLLAVVALASSSSARRVQRLRAVGLVVTSDWLAEVDSKCGSRRLTRAGCN